MIGVPPTPEDEIKVLRDRAFAALEAIALNQEAGREVYAVPYIEPWLLDLYDAAGRQTPPRMPDVIIDPDGTRHGKWRDPKTGRIWCFHSEPPHECLSMGLCWCERRDTDDVRAVWPIAPVWVGDKEGVLLSDGSVRTEGKR